MKRRHSPSALKLLAGCEGCPRKYGFRYVDKIEIDREDKPWLAQNSRMHKHLEIAKLTGKTPDQSDPEARCASAAIEHWPDRVWHPEVQIGLRMPGFTLFGFSDQLGPGFVGDYKFTGDKKKLPEPRAYWATQVFPRLRASRDRLISDATKALSNDVQVLSYGLYTLLAYKPDLEAVDFLWTYVIKPPKLAGQAKSIPVEFSLTRQDLVKGAKYLTKLGAVANHLRANYLTAHDMPIRPSACGGVGLNCDYSDHCKITKGAIVAGQTIDDLMEELGIEVGGVNPKEAKKRRVDDDDDEPAPKKRKPAVDDDDDDEPAPKKSRRRKRPADDDDDDEPAPKKRKPVVDDDDDDEPAPKKTRRRKRPTDDEDDEEPAPKKRKPVVDDDDDDAPAPMVVVGTAMMGSKKCLIVATDRAAKIGDKL